MPRRKEPKGPAATTEPTVVSKKKKRGRPPKGQEPLIDFAALDALLVFGEVRPAEHGPGTTVVYPTFRELGQRFGVSHTSIGVYATKHNCARRRQEAEDRVRAKTDQKLVELRASQIALAKSDVLRIVDGYMVQFETAVIEGRVRFDNPNDFVGMARLRELLVGGPDGRQEVSTVITLEQIQERYRKAQEVAKASPALRGERQRFASPTLLAHPAAETPPLAEVASMLPEVDLATSLEASDDPFAAFPCGVSDEKAGNFPRERAPEKRTASARSVPAKTVATELAHREAHAVVPAKPPAAGHAPPELAVPTSEGGARRAGLRWPTAAALAALTGMKPKREEEP